MKERLSKKVLGIKNSGLLKFFDAASEMEGVISLGVGEPDFDTPAHIRDAGIQSLQEGQTFYTANSGLKELRRGISDYLKKTTHQDYDSESELIVTVGGSEGIDIALRSIINPGDEIAYVAPAFVAYDACILLAGGRPVPIPLKQENKFRLTREELESVITPKTKALILSFPNNPTGAIMEKEDLQALLDVIIEHDLIVISDEIYSELTYGKEHVSIASLPGMRERTLIISGFSKSFAMTGWRMGYVAGDKEIIEELFKIHQYIIMSAPTVSQYAAIEALKNGEPDVIRMREAYDERRHFLLAEMKRIGLKCFEPEGAFYVFPDITEFGLSSEDFAYELLNDQKLAVVPGRAFGESGEGFIRISYAYSMDELKEAMKRLEAFISQKRA